MDIVTQFLYSRPYVGDSSIRKVKWGAFKNEFKRFRCEPVFIQSKSRLHQKIERIISRRPSSEENHRPSSSDKEEKPTRLKILDIWIGSVKLKMEPHIVGPTRMSHFDPYIGILVPNSEN